MEHRLNCSLISSFFHCHCPTIKICYCQKKHEVHVYFRKVLKNLLNWCILPQNQISQSAVKLKPSLGEDLIMELSAVRSATQCVAAALVLQHEGAGVDQPLPLPTPPTTLPEMRARSKISSTRRPRQKEPSILPSPMSSTAARFASSPVPSRSFAATSRPPGP